MFALTVENAFHLYSHIPRTAERALMHYPVWCAILLAAIPPVERCLSLSISVEIRSSCCTGRAPDIYFITSDWKKGPLNFPFFVKNFRGFFFVKLLYFYSFDIC